MSQTDIICKATTDTFVRFGIVILALFGFSLYFVYDGAIGYAKKNEVICSYKAFAALGDEAVQTQDAATWQQARSTTPLLKTEKTPDGQLLAVEGESRYPLPADCAAAMQCPQEVMDLQAMQDWHNCWEKYTSRMGMPIKPGEHPYDAGAIREQWIGSVVGFALVLLGLYYVVRTYKRELSLRGDVVTAAGQSFKVSEITLIDLRQWGPGFKGIAYFTVNGKKVKVDGMTYGGFNKDKGEPAEAFMKAVLALYKGDIVEYEQTDRDADTPAA
ncbi:MAG: hypothetical protein IJY53_06415 [Akkermansia sp.]|nr:hypothetical protein [Akkermansia sp.]